MICGNCFAEVTNEDALFCPKCGRSLYVTNPPDALRMGTILNGRYIVGITLGQGGFGITYKALDHRTGDVVALKEYFLQGMCHRNGSESPQVVTVTARSDDFSWGMRGFLTEAKTLASLTDRPGIVHVHEYFEENGTAYFSMDYVEGQDIKRYLKQHGDKLSWEVTCSILYPVITSLGYVHKQHIVHRDIAPDNICVTRSGAGVLLDFGAARVAMGDRTQTMSVILKRGYAPREQYLGRSRQGPWTDVYALAATMYRCLTGITPPESLERSTDVANGLPDPLKPIHEFATLDPKLEAVVLKALSVEAQDRYQTMGEFRRALLDASLPDPPPPPDPVDPPKKNHTVLAALLAFLLAALLTGPSVWYVAKRYKRSELAVQFVMDMDNNVISIDGDDGDSDNVQMVSDQDWKARLLTEVDPSSELYSTITGDPWFYIDAVSIVRNARVTGVDGDAYTVSFEQAWTQGSVSGWSQDFSQTSAVVTFSDRDLVMSYDYRG